MALPCPSGQQVYSASLELSTARPGENEVISAAFDQVVYLIEKLGQLLDFVNDHDLVIGTTFGADVTKKARILGKRKKCTTSQEIDDRPRAERHSQQGGLPGTSRTEQEDRFLAGEFSYI